MIVAALYVDPHGVYSGLPDVDVWGEERDARLYDGPHPVVAHPPCGKWSPIAYINRRRLPGYEIGDDGGCFAAALAAVRRFGGVLEHPALSLAWKHFGLPKPARGFWTAAATDEAGWVTEVDQGRYGHRARKRTWLYVVSSALYLPTLDWAEASSSVVVSGFLHRTGTDETRRVRPKEASATPPAFRDVLLDLARGAGGRSAAA